MWNGSFLVGTLIFVFSKTCRPAMGPTQPSIQWTPGVLSPSKKKRTGREAGHSLPSGAGSRMRVGMATLPICLHSLCLYNKTHTLMPGIVTFCCTLQSGVRCGVTKAQTNHCIVTFQCKNVVRVTGRGLSNFLVLECALLFCHLQDQLFAHTNLPAAAVGRGVHPSCRSGGHPCRLPRALAYEKTI
jgi:hypothetical protein